MGVPDKYANFTELDWHETEQVDYRIHFRNGNSGVAILAPHGGKIERGTMAIANAIAGPDHSFYCFEGIKPRLRDNRDLHIASNCFDEPRALAAVAKADRVLTIHGAKGGEAAVYAGGLDWELRYQILQALTEEGFYACNDPSPTRQGRGLSNICNQGKSGQGLQLELTFGIRKLLFGEADWHGSRTPTELFYRLVKACRIGIERTNL